MILSPKVFLSMAFAFLSAVPALCQDQPKPQTYEHSVAGLETQFADVLQIVRSGNESAIHAALDTLIVPDAKAWITENFPPESVEQEWQIYQQGTTKFQSHVWWVMGNLGPDPDFALKVTESETPKPLSDVGFESLVPRPKNPVAVENFRFASTVSNPKFGSPSWVSSFIYLDGRFRMIGGTYPFWSEGLNAVRGPMSLAPQVVNGRNVQGRGFGNDTKRTGIDAIVHIRIELERDGKLKKMKVLSGDPAFITDAETYLKNSEFPRMPDDPRIPAKSEWDMEVVFFSTKTP